MILSSLRIVGVALALTAAAPVLAQETTEETAEEAIEETAATNEGDGFDLGWLGLLGLLGLAGLRGRRNDHTNTTTMR